MYTDHIHSYTCINYIGHTLRPLWNVRVCCVRGSTGISENGHRKLQHELDDGENNVDESNEYNAYSKQTKGVAIKRLII